MIDFDETKDLENLFLGIGLTEKEARLYRVLLEIGQGSAGDIINKAGLKRGITYNILYKLIKLGLIRSFVKEGKTLFQPQNPQKLIELVNSRKQQIDSLEMSLKQIVPRLVSQYKLAVGKPTISYFEGEEGIRTVFEDIYAPKKEIVWGCVDLEEADKAFPTYVLEKLVPKRIKNKVLAFSFVADSPAAREIAKKDKQQLRKTVLLDKQDYPLPAEIDVYEDKIAMLSFEKGEFIGLIIENKSLAESLRSVFKLAFRRGGKSPADKDTRAKAG